jgi:hypothetical protein
VGGAPCTEQLRASRVTFRNVPPIQDAVTRYKKALSIPEKLIQLHPGTVGAPGAAGAIAPAVVLMSISAFEGFIEDVTAAALYLNGDTYSRIAQVVGNWTNPDIEKWRNELDAHFGVKLESGFSVRTTRGVASRNWSKRRVTYKEGAELGSGWMNTRHALTHGSASGRGAERWPASVRRGKPPSLVLRPSAQAGKHHLELPGARGCAALYTYAARHGVDLLAAAIGQPPPNWSGFPDFDP